VRFRVLPDDDQTGLTGVRMLGQRDNKVHRAFNGPDRPKLLSKYSSARLKVTVSQKLVCLSQYRQ
jgi:hypothetical protein